MPSRVRAPVGSCAKFFAGISMIFSNRSISCSSPGRRSLQEPTYKWKWIFWLRRSRLSSFRGSHDFGTPLCHRIGSGLSARPFSVERNDLRHTLLLPLHPHVFLLRHRSASCSRTIPRLYSHPPSSPPLPALGWLRP